MPPSVEKRSGGSENGEAGFTKAQNGEDLKQSGVEQPDTSKNMEDAELKESKDTEKKQSKIAQLWGKLGLDVPTILMMMK